MGHPFNKYKQNSLNIFDYMIKPLFIYTRDFWVCVVHVVSGCALCTWFLGVRCARGFWVCVVHVVSGCALCTWFLGVCCARGLTIHETILELLK